MFPALGQVFLREDGGVATGGSTTQAYLGRVATRAAEVA